MGGVPGAEERGRVVGAVGRAGPGHVILSLGPLPGMASLTLWQATLGQGTLSPQLAVAANRLNQARTKKKKITIVKVSGVAVNHQSSHPWILR